ncbi:MAG TPA: phage portal protein, partial [Pyrinomonadaceae bacterium]
MSLARQLVQRVKFAGQIIAGQSDPARLAVGIAELAETGDRGGDVLARGLIKSLRDQATGGDTIQTAHGSVAVARFRGGDGEVFKKQNVLRLRQFAENSIWVRAALDISRNALAQAAWMLKPIDPKRPMNKMVERDIRELLDTPNPAGLSYAQLKEQFIEDYMVVGHGTLESLIRNDAAPYGFVPMDAATVAFVKGWDGTDPGRPRYVQLHPGGQVRRYLADPHVMCMVNRPRSYDLLGLSHVEVLDMTVRALIEGDNFLFSRVADPAPSGALNLGEGVTQTQVDQVRAEIQAVKKAFVVMGGTSKAEFVSFNPSEREMQLLDTQVWFVRQVAAVFGIPTAMLALAVDTSRANTEAMLSNAVEGFGQLLFKLREMENQQIAGRFGRRSAHNVMLDYPVMGKKDEKIQSEITRTQVGGRAFVSINDAREASGLSKLKLAVADEILVDVAGLPTPLSLLQERFDAGEDLDGGRARAEQDREEADDVDDEEDGGEEEK